MAITLSDEARRYVAAFEEATDARARDCLVDDDRVVFVVAMGDMGAAIGPNGTHVQTLESDFGVDVILVEDADTPAAFVANALAPAAVRNVTISESDTTVAYVEVTDADRGVAIGAEGDRIDLARTLAARHFDIDDVQLA